MIFTLYSYKGGVGRSMALANLAHWFYLRGLTVLMVDWDLEAPGLESFFYKSEEKIELVRSHLGVIDLLSAYCRQFPYMSGPASWDALPGVESYLCEIEPEVDYQSATRESRSRGRLRLLSAGWRSGGRFAEYAEAVHAFEWAGFYTRFRGEEYFNWLRGQLASLADVVLVDSRTGITEMGGVCTRHLADVVVTLCAPNSQNLQGALEMADSFRSDQLAAARGRRLEVLFLPARIDDQDSAGHGVFRGQFVSGVERFTPDVFRKWKRSPWDLAIPYKAQYSYGESLVTGVEGSNEQIELSYRQLATHMALFSTQGSKLWNACLPEMKPLAAAAGIDLATPAWHEAEAVVAEFNAQELDEARRALLRLVHFSPQSPSLDSRQRSTLADLAAAGSRDVIDRLTKAGVVTRVEEADSKAPESLELTHESVVPNWPRLRDWIEPQRALLLWRQDLGAQAAKWMGRDQDPALLLRGGPLREALAKSAGAELNAAETMFVLSSRKFEEERERTEREQAERARLAEQEVRRRRRRLRLMLATAGSILILLLVAGAVYLRSNGFQAWYVVRQGVKINVTPTEDDDPTEDWRNALLASGHVAEALDGVRHLLPGRDKFLTLADAANFLWAAGLKADAAQVASEALNFSADSLKRSASSTTFGGDSSEGSSDYPRTLVEVFSNLSNRSMSPPKDKVEQLVSSFTPATAEDGVYIFGRLLGLVDSPELRKKYLASALAVTDNRRRCAALVSLVSGAGKFQPSLEPGVIEKATYAALAIPDAGQKADALLDIADAQPSDATRAAAMKAVQSLPPSRDKAGDLVQVAFRLAQDHKPGEAADQFAKAREVAKGLAPDERASVLLDIADGSPDLAVQVLDEAASLEIKLNANRIIDIASEYAAHGKMDSALKLLDTVPLAVGRTPARQASLPPATVGPQSDQLDGLVRIAMSAWWDHRSEDARSAALAAVALYTKAPNSRGNRVTRLIQILYPDPSAMRLVGLVSTPDAYLALGRAARSAGNAEQVRRAREEALALAGKLSGADKSAALSQVAQDYAVDGRLYAARRLADQCLPNDRLAAYTAILNAHSIQARPELRNVIGGIFQIRK
ncbi:MAG TPA: hypothetical protein VE959_22220 [Bryobacteraceae bacterium]|nr:hypothetical protein [Bryobacteraceae bacterium]